MRVYFGLGFSMSYAGTTVTTDEDGFAEVQHATPELMQHAKEPPKPTTIKEIDK